MSKLGKEKLALSLKINEMQDNNTGVVKKIASPSHFRNNEIGKKFWSTDKR